MNPPSVLPPATVAPAQAPASHPAFQHAKTWRWFAAELQWGLIFGALLGFAASLALSLAFTLWNEATNRLIEHLIRGWQPVSGLSPVGYFVSLAMLIAGIAWGVIWRKRFRRHFQRQFRL